MLRSLAIPLAVLAGCSQTGETQPERNSTASEDADFARMATAGKMLTDLGEYLDESDPAPRSFTFDRLIFERGSFAIRAVDEQTLYALAHSLQERPKVRMRVVGYDDGAGTQGGALALARASAVVQFLRRAGVLPDRLDAAAGRESHGSRATELVVLSK